MFDYSDCNDNNPEIFPQNGLDSWKYKRQHVSIRKYMNKLYEDGFKHPYLDGHMKANSFEFCRDNMDYVNVNNLNVYPASFWTGLFYKIDYEEMKEENQNNISNTETKKVKQRTPKLQIYANEKFSLNEFKAINLQKGKCKINIIVENQRLALPDLYKVDTNLIERIRSIYGVKEVSFDE